MKYHIHYINNQTICPTNQTHSVRKCWKSQESPFAEHDLTHLNTEAATFPVNMFMLTENLHKNIHLPFTHLLCLTSILFFAYFLTKMC